MYNFEMLKLIVGTVTFRVWKVEDLSENLTEVRISLSKSTSRIPSEQ